MKYRLVRVKEVVLRELGLAITRELTFDAQLVTVNSVDMTPDLKHCHVYVGVIGSERDKEQALEALNANRALLQRELSQRVTLKYTPQLHFHIDESIERGVKIGEILRQIDEITPLEEEE